MTEVIANIPKEADRYIEQIESKKKSRFRMTNIAIYSDDAKKLNEAAAKVGESVATVIEWLVEENLDDLVKEQTNEHRGI